MCVLTRQMEARAGKGKKRLWLLGLTLLLAAEGDCKSHGAECISDQDSYKLMMTCSRIKSRKHKRIEGESWQRLSHLLTRIWLPGSPNVNVGARL
ncbi:hypothetical protein Tco_1049249 [Tanacetum coccineum]